MDANVKGVLLISFACVFVATSSPRKRRRYVYRAAIVWDDKQRGWFDYLEIAMSWDCCRFRILLPILTVYVRMSGISNFLRDILKLRTSWRAARSDIQVSLVCVTNVKWKRVKSTIFLSSVLYECFRGILKCPDLSNQATHDDHNIISRHR